MTRAPAYKHKWNLRSSPEGHDVCQKCGMTRDRHRTYVKRAERGGRKGATLFQTWYDGERGPAPLCVPF